MTETASVKLWGSEVGAVTWDADRGIGVFQYSAEFLESGIEVSPLMMPLAETIYEFPELSRDTFKGLPGMLADSLPDKFGNALIEAWLAQNNRSPNSFTPVERLCYTGVRGMGALEFEPSLFDNVSANEIASFESLVRLANRVLDDRIALDGKFSGDDDQRVIEDILRVGTSAGGACAKAVLALNEDTLEFYSGQNPSPAGFSHWLIKFDGVAGNQDKDIADPQGFGRIEYAYYLMGKEAGINLNECRLFEEGDRTHFMTKRFDRTENGEKIHMQSLGAMMHFDFNFAGANAYEQVLQTIQRLGLPKSDMDQQIRRTYFNILARNQDDHVKNIAFLMNREGEWRLSPAFDVAYSFNPAGDWTSLHQMTLAGKRTNFTVQELIEFAMVGDIAGVKARGILSEVSNAVANWRKFADLAGGPRKDTDRISKTHRRELFV